MTRGTRRVAGLAAALFLAALAQCVWADAMRIHSARPDFLTAVTVLGALFCNANEGAGVGFVAGLITASLAAPASGFGSLILSRTLLGFLVGWLEERVFRDNAPFAVALVALGTPLAEILFFIFAPQRNVLHWARAAGFTTLYNLLLALPLYFIVSRLVGAHRADRE